MKKEYLKFLNSRLILIVLLLIIGGMLVLFLQPNPVFAASGIDDPDTQPEQPDNDYCLGCHSLEGQTYTFASGEIISITVTADAFEKSIHGSQEFLCTDCHTEIKEYPHPEIEVQYSREYTHQYDTTCSECHEDKYDNLMDSVHAEVLELGNLNAPVCSDCHDPHAQSVEGISALSIELGKTSQICAQCHNSIYVEYAQSVHGSALINENNPDVPSCEDCHGIHLISDPRTNEARLASPQICADCHTNSAIMDKYGLSTNVLDTYVADFHGTTVTLFEETSPDQPTNKPVCYDCHGVHNVSSVSDPEKGLEIQENLLVTCQKCHPDASLSFSASWMSHYDPSPDKYPLVYYVNLFYKVMIPGVIGGMALFVVTDFGRKILNNRQRKNADKTKGEMESSKEGEVPPAVSKEGEE